MESPERQLPLASPPTSPLSSPPAKSAKPPFKEPDESSYILEGQKLIQQAQAQTRVRTALASSDGFCEEEDAGDSKRLVQSDDERYQTSLPLASFNYINSIIGSGVIGIPFALQQAGFGLGVLLLLLVAVLTDYSLVLMVRGGHLCGAMSYQGLMRAAFGQPGFILLSALQFAYPFIAMVSYNIVVGDTITKVLTRMIEVDPDSLLARREFVVALATIFITVPLCLYRDIAKLSKVSFLSLVFVSFILVTIFIRLATPHENVPSTPDAWQFANSGIIPAIGIMAFAFMCHHNTFLLYESIENASQERWNTVTHASVFTSCCVTLLFGIAGYATFTGLSQGDLLENYCPRDDLMNISRAAFSITILLTYPIECFVTREVIEKSLFKQESEEQSPTFQHAALTLTLVIAAYFISITTDCLGVVLELNGVLAAVPLAYVLPALCYVKLEEGPLFSSKKIPAILLASFGLIVAILGLIMLFTDYQKIDTCSHDPMPYCLKQ